MSTSGDENEPERVKDLMVVIAEGPKLGSDYFLPALKHFSGKCRGM